MPILEETLQHLESHGIAERRIVELRLGNYFTVIQLDDANVGACMSYYSLPEVELARREDELRERLSSDPLLLCFLFSERPHGALTGALRATVLSALSSALLRRGGDDGFIAASSPPYDVLDGVSTATVVGFGGYMDTLARDPRVHRLHVSDLRYPQRRREMDGALEAYRQRRPDLSITVSDGRDTARHMAASHLVSITGSALSNGTLEDLLADARSARRVLVQGQSAAIHPRALFDRGAELIVTTIKPRNLVALADMGELARVLEGGLPLVYLWARREKTLPCEPPSRERTWWRRYAELCRGNGYSEPPVEVYRAFLSQVDRPGRILELGCGNGLLLRYLCDFSAHDLLPAGIDTDEALIDQARTVVFPRHASGFQAADVRSCDFGHGYDVLIANPLYADQGYYEQRQGLIVGLHADGSMARFVKRCFEALRPGGRLVLFCYRGQLHEIVPWRRAFDEELAVVPLRRLTPSPGRVSFFVADRPV